ncbi:MAG: hypothetical protein BroJett011_33710 [Chloroflexota bacterium]|nr:MAG: hypothetical protein BroJett011_33710 [Chloroflexota bacterium]
MSDKLAAWVAREVKQRGWSYRELARQAGISQSLVSKTLSGNMPPSADFCIKIAQALGEAPEVPLRLAEILPLPSTSEDDPTLVELHDVVQHLLPDQRKEALRYLRFLYQSQQGET